MDPEVIAALVGETTIVRADRAYAGRFVTRAKEQLNLTIKTGSRPKDASGFVVLPRPWVVERSLAWITHTHRHARDYERLVQHPEFSERPTCVQVRLSPTTARRTSPAALH